MTDYAHMDSDQKVRAHVLDPENAAIIARWAHAIVVEEIDPFDPTIKSPGLNVQCGDTVKRASLGDYVIKYGDGTYDVKSQFDFMANYTQL